MENITRKPTIYNSITHGELTELQLFNIILSEINAAEAAHYELDITIGTDSQRHDGRTKIVTVICLHRVGHGGVFFYTTEYIKKIEDLRHKIYHETSCSLELAQKLMDFLFSHNKDYNITIHADIGRSRKGRTHTMIQEIVGWVNSQGFECHFKPNSYTASCVADKITKPI